MPIAVCPHCDHQGRVPAEAVGKEAACPGCGKRFTVHRGFLKGEQPEPVKATWKCPYCSYNGPTPELETRPSPIGQAIAFLWFMEWVAVGLVLLALKQLDEPGKLAPWLLAVLLCALPGAILRQGFRACQNCNMRFLQ
jgi:hypothetical protein